MGAISWIGKSDGSAGYSEVIRSSSLGMKTKICVVEWEAWSLVLRGDYP